LLKSFSNRPSPAIVFDFGGVLMDWNPHYLFDKLMNNDREAVDAFLERVSFRRWNEDFDLGKSFSEGTAELIARFPEYTHLIRAYDTHYLDTVRGCHQSVVDILQELKHREYPLFGLSNWSAEKFSLVRRKYPFFEYFEDIVLSGDVGLIKPAKEMYLLLLQRNSLSAQDCLFIDDYEPNVKTALDLGFQAVQFISAEQLRADLAGRGILSPQ
jgi:2-haloacid dehalogenase